MKYLYCETHKISTMPFNKLDDTAIGKIRPRFKLETPLSKEEAMDLINKKAQEDESISSSSFTRFIKLRSPVEERHYWSPVMNLTFEWDEYDNKTLIRGVIGPNEKVWSMFMFFYIGIIAIGMFGGIFALVKWQVNDNPNLLFIIPLSIFIFGSIFSTVKYGKRKGHTQMLHLLRFLRKSVDDIDCVRSEDCKFEKK